MDTIKINHGKTLLIAHRGVSGLELENTCAAFVAAGNRSYFGIETDIHRTADGKFIVIHDDRTGRVCDTDISVEGSDYDTLRGLRLRTKDGARRWDLVMPNLEEYLRICAYYGKKAVLELKNPFDRDSIEEVIEICKQTGGLENVIFISFFLNNMRFVKDIAPTANAQYLMSVKVDLANRPDLVAELVERGIDVDVDHKMLTKELVDLLHEKGLVINCWTVDDPARGEELVCWGVDYITTNILE